MNSIFISVRTSSTRLPNKAILDLCGKPTIQYLIENLKKSKCAKKIILCTSNQPEDDILCQLAERLKIDYFRGSLEDKIDRWLGACEKYNVDFFVNVDGDDLFFDYGLADIVIRQYNKSRADFIDGQGLYNDVYGISRKGIEEVCRNKKRSDTEFIKPHFYNIKDLINIESVLHVPARYQKQQIRLTLDYIEDYEFFKTIIDHFKKFKLDLNFENILTYLKKTPSVVKMNWHRESDWSQNQKIMIKNMKLNFGKKEEA